MPEDTPVTILRGREKKRPPTDFSSFLPFFSGAVLFIFAALPGRADTLGVVELFTSQGCSSCPPADRLLGEMAQEPNIVALSFPVDYWDYLGWKDTFAHPDYSRRQRDYAKARGDRAIYTPQVVINGRDHIIGSDGVKIRESLASHHHAHEGMIVPLTAHLDEKSGRLAVHIPRMASPLAGQAAVWIASYRRPETVHIGEGENSGASITYVNLVERWQVLGLWEGEAMSLELPLSDITSEKTAGCAVILQMKTNGLPGPILGATKVALENRAE